jgi:hypothetical protein
LSAPDPIEVIREMLVGQPVEPAIADDDPAVATGG